MNIPHCSLLFVVWMAFWPGSVPGGLLAQVPEEQQVLRLDSLQQGMPASIADVAWIAGHWRAEALGGVCEEIWSGPEMGNMMGVFRLLGAGEVQFFELMTIREVGPSLELRLKHFHSDLRGWEPQHEALRFPLVRWSPQAAWFDGMTFLRRSPDQMDVLVRFDSGGPREQVVTFPYRRFSPGME